MVSVHEIKYEKFVIEGFKNIKVPLKKREKGGSISAIQ